MSRGRTWVARTLRTGRGYMDCTCGHRLWDIRVPSDFRHKTGEQVLLAMLASYETGSRIITIGFHVEKAIFTRPRGSIKGVGWLERKIGGCCKKCGHSHEITIADVITTSGNCFHVRMAIFAELEILSFGYRLLHSTDKDERRWFVRGTDICCSKCEAQIGGLDQWHIAKYHESVTATSIGVRAYFDVVKRWIDWERPPLVYWETRRGAQGLCLRINLRFARACDTIDSITGRCLGCNQQISVSAEDRAILLRKFILSGQMGVDNRIAE